MSKEWLISPSWPDREVAARRWNVPPLVAQLLYNRGIDLNGAPAAFLSPQLRDLNAPENLSGATEAARLIAEAVRAGQKIVLYGDYDVDGICGVAILWQVLTSGGAKIEWYVPHRLEEGYGLNPEAIRTLLKDGAQVIVSIDCGITAVEEARIVRQAGAVLIISDHHQPPADLPQAAVLVHPLIDNGSAESCANPHLCGAGVAFKLAWAVAKALSGGERVQPAFRDALMATLPLAALGTVADCVPLTGENRIIARHGLAALKTSSNVGVQALIQSAGLTGANIDGYDAGFRLAPRLNAAGRMGHARLAVELLTQADANRAREIALYLEDHNRNRQAQERAITKEACQMVEARGMHRDACRGIVLAAEKWHAGVIGIVAARLVDRFQRPTVMIALENGLGQGSARSVPHFHMHQALSACAEHLETFGGHAMAAGLRIASARIAAFTEAFLAHANQTLTGADLRSKLRLDAEVELAELDVLTVQALRNLGPFGEGHPEPRLATDWCNLVGEPRRVGKSSDHLQFSLEHHGAILKGIGFGLASAEEALKTHRRCRVAFAPILNEYNSRTSVELQVLDFQFPQ
ncbi:MAG TPA: single-stranded-DNA-specific exonuclease RecJ [Phycisphaerae bacterium]|jgi:single-stranded-DNA-specific exonuclease